ncbi:hypothetical protein D3C78_1841260 [compost metagenome]
MGIPGAVFTDQGFRAQVVLGRLMVTGRGSSGQARFTSALARQQSLALLFRQFVTDSGAGFFSVEIQLTHRAHAVFVVIDGFRLHRIVRTS